MQIILADHMGFCHGVKRAVDLAEKSGDGSYTLGPLIHNPQMVAKLQGQGIKKVDSLYGIKPNSKVVFRSHGEPPINYQVAQNRSLEIVDATCPHVKKAQKAAQELSQQGFDVVIIGEANHPEVVSIKAWAGSNVVVVENGQDIEKLPKDKRYGIVVQTTCTEELFQKLSKLIEAKASEFKVMRTICNATHERQQAAISLAKKVDTMIVIGGKNSSNTKKLAKVVLAHCPNAIFIETADELTVDMLKGSEKIGITAGASTPDWLVEEVIEKMENMQESLEQGDVAIIKKDSIITGKVVSVGKDEIFVDINYKSEGIIPRQELSLLPPENLADLIKIGDSISAMVINLDKEGSVLLSKLKADAIVAEEKLIAAKESDEVLDVLVTAVVKGGITVEVLGVRGFIPASHVDVERIEDFTSFVGKKIPAKIIELELATDKKRIVLSRREVLKAQKAIEEKAAYQKIKVSKKYSGTVTRLAKFGAFVDIGGVEGLLHVSEMSWQRVKDPAEILQVGDKVQVLVQKVDVDNKKISLNLRDLQQDPWFTLVEKFAEGQIVEGKVSKMATFGAFVAIADNLEGLVHVSEIAEDRVGKPEEVLEIGQSVKVKILKIDKKAKKISLSILQAKKDEEKEEFKDYLENKEEFTTSISKLLEKYVFE